MTSIPLGLVTVPSAGTPVPITAPAGTLPPSGGVYRIDVTAVNGAAGNVLIKDAHSGNIMKELLPPADGNTARWSIDTDHGGNAIQPSRLVLDAAVNGDGAFVTLWIK